MYFIACMRKIELDEDGWVDVGSDRIVGFSDTFEEADKWVKNNVVDISDHIYWYAVIQQIEPGIYPRVENEWWYHFNTNSDGFDPIPCPDGITEDDGYYMFR